MSPPTSSHDLNRTGEKLAAGVQRVQAASWRTVEQARQAFGSTFSVLGRFPWRIAKRIARGLAACLIWLVACAAVVGLLLVLGVYDHFPSSVVVRDYSANQVKLKEEDDLYLEIVSIGTNDNARGFTQLPQEPLRTNLQLSLYRLANQDLSLKRTFGAGTRAFVQNQSFRKIYSSQSFVAWLPSGNAWEYKIVEPLTHSRLNVEPHVLLAEDLETLNFDALAIHSPVSFVSSAPAPAVLLSADSYEYHPILSDAQPLIDWFRATDLEEARCVAFGTSLMGTLTKLKMGDSVKFDSHGETRLKPLAALLDLELFQPQGDGRLQIQWHPHRWALVQWLLATGGIALVGCIIILWWMRPSRHAPLSPA